MVKVGYLGSSASIGKLPVLSTACLAASLTALSGPDAETFTTAPLALTVMVKVARCVEPFAAVGGL